jgi:acetyl-CoA carboxylase biotin carboxyl carrier protein
VLTFEQIKELIELVSEHRLQGVELERSGFRLKIDGQVTVAAAVALAPSPGGSETGQLALVSPPAAAPPSALPTTPAPPVAGEPAGPPPGSHIMTSPIVGTFYRAPAPGADSFVEVGSRVKKGQVLCIVEAMKLMNEIECDVDGTIVEIYPQNAQAVEFGEPLFAIRPA